MYFLAKNLRTCSKSIKGTPDNLQLYKNGVLNWEYLTKNMSFFLMHPEQLKQKIKERDAHMLCQFFDSDEYKQRVTAFLETQSRILSKDTLADAKRVKYQHVLSCAQPAHKKARMFVEPEVKQEIKVNQVRNKKPKKGTIIEQLIMRRHQIGADKEHESVRLKKSTRPKKMRQRTTIMPIFLKKMKKKHEALPEEEEDEIYPELHTQTARKVTAPEGAPEPMYAQILHRSNIYSKGLKNSDYKENFNAQKAENLDFVAEGNAPISESAQKVKSLLHRAKRRKTKVLASEQPDQAPSKEDKTGVKEKAVAQKLSNLKNDCLDLDNAFSRSDNFGRKTSSKLDHVPSRLSKVASKFDDVSLKLGGPSNIGHVPLRMSSFTAKSIQKGPTAKLCPKKNINMNLKSFSEFLCVERVGSRVSKAKKVGKAKIEPGKTVKIEILNKPKTKNKLSSSASEVKGKKKSLSLQMLMDNVNKNRSLNVEYDLERKNTMVAIRKNRGANVKKKDELEVLSLFEKVKMGKR